MIMALQLLTTGERSASDTLAADLVALRMVPGRQRLLATAVTVYCRWLQDDPDRRPATCRAYASDVMAFVDAMAQQGIALIEDVNTAGVELWKHGMAGLEPSTICRKLTAVSGFFEWGMLWELCKDNPVERVRRPRKKHIEPVHLTLTDFHKLMGACRTPQESALLGCLFWGGLRAHEPGSLRIGDVDLEGRKMRVLGKGGRVRNVPLCLNLQQLLKDHLVASGLTAPDQPVFRNTRGGPLGSRIVYRWFMRWVSHAGLAGRGYSPHSARHGTGTLLGLVGFNGYEISRYLGHEDCRTTLQYVHASPEALMVKLDEVELFGTAPPDAGEDPRIAALQDQMAHMTSVLDRIAGVILGGGQPQNLSGHSLNQGGAEDGRCVPVAASELSGEEVPQETLVDRDHQGGQPATPAQ